MAHHHARPLLIGGGVGVGGFAVGVLIAWAAAPLAAHAQATIEPPRRTLALTVYGNDPCPSGASGEIVVCARRPESERYRLPRSARGRRAAESPAANAWGNKVRGTEEASRTAAGLPDTCSAVGSGGQSGCQHQFLMQAGQQRQLDQQGTAGAP